MHDAVGIPPLLGGSTDKRWIPQITSAINLACGSNSAHVLGLINAGEMLEAYYLAMALAEPTATLPHRLTRRNHQVG